MSRTRSGFVVIKTTAGPRLASNRAMDKSLDTDKRLTELEIKASFTEDLLDQLNQVNQVIVRQQQQIDLLLREIARLGQQGAPSDGTSARSLRDELPPHY